MYAKLWNEDYLSKCQREEMEAALQIERNKEMLEVISCDIVNLSYTAFGCSS